VSKLHPFIAVVVLLMIVVLNATAIFSIYEAAAIGIMVLLVTDTLTWNEVYSAIPGNLMLMICYSFAIAAAMNKSGLGQLIGEGFAVSFVGHPYIQLFGIFFCTVRMLAEVLEGELFLFFDFCLAVNHHCDCAQQRCRHHHVSYCGQHVSSWRVQSA